MRKISFVGVLPVAALTVFQPAFAQTEDVRKAAAKAKEEHITAHGRAQPLKDSAGILWQFQYVECWRGRFGSHY